MIVCAGENLIDMIQQPEAGDAPSPAFRALVGGSPYNCARALGRLGVEVGYLTPISDDRMGDLLAQALLQDGVALLGPRSARPTSLALVALEDGQPRYQFYREGVADRDITLARLREGLPAAARALHVGSISLLDGPDADAIADLVAEARGRGLFTTVDPNVRPALIGADDDAYRMRLARVCAAADVIKISDEDLGWLAPDRDTESAAMALWAEAAPALLVVTRGDAGAIGLHAAGRLEVPAAPVPRLADTVGAGDTFMAALLDGLAGADALDPAALVRLPKARLEAILMRAARAAAITCSRAGCNPPHRAELDR